MQPSARILSPSNFVVKEFEGELYCKINGNNVRITQIVCAIDKYVNKLLTAPKNESAENKKFHRILIFTCLPKDRVEIFKDVLKVLIRERIPLDSAEIKTRVAEIIYLKYFVLDR